MPANRNMKGKIMKNFKVQLAVMGALGLIAVPSHAAFVSLPSSGASSAYIACNTTGDFGSLTSIKPPTDGCVVSQAGANPPDPTGAGAGHALYLGSAKTRPIVVNNTYTGGVNKTIGNVQDWVWKNAAGTSCIYGTKLTMTFTTAADYNTATGAQYFEVNDIARGGFAGKTITAAYSYPGSPSEVVFRVGRTYTSVQHRVGDTDIPPNAGSVVSINGLDAWPGSASAAQQQAPWHDNWVDFTTDVNARDDDGSTTAASSWVYVKADACPALSGGVPVDTPDAIRIRQTFQERSTDGANPPADQRFIEISLPGFAPAGSSATPAHTNPF